MYFTLMKSLEKFQGIANLKVLKIIGIFSFHMISLKEK